MSLRGGYLLFPIPSRMFLSGRSNPLLLGDCFGKNKNASQRHYYISLTNHPRPAILNLIKLTFTVAIVGSLFMNNRNVARIYPLASKSAGVFFYAEHKSTASKLTLPAIGGLVYF